MARLPAAACTASLVLLMGIPWSARAQDATFLKEGGFQPNREYLGLLPFEAIDTASNNVILTFTDLTLPGNAGRALRFQRVFTNQVIPDPAGPQWRFGIAGVPMTVVERPHPTLDQPIEPAGDITAERLTAPYFPMLDGSRLETTYVQAPGHLTWRKVQTANFWRYDRVTRVLRKPDGTVAHYDAEGRLVRIADAFSDGGTNVVTLTWSSAEIKVVQSLGQGETREVTVVLNEATGLPERLAYLGRIWTYSYADGQLTSVAPPVGPPWKYDYSSDPFSPGKVVRVTTPLGGSVEYAYEDREFMTPWNTEVQVLNVLSARRVYDGTQLMGEWTFEHSAVSDLAFDRTVVTHPSGTSTTYVYGGYTPTANVLAGNWLLRFRYIHAPDGRLLETQEWEYDLLKAARTQEGAAVPWGVPRVIRHRVTRAGQTHTTEYAYNEDLSESPFHDFHRPATITERRPGGSVARQTRIAYEHLCHGAGCDGPAFLALPRTEEVTVAGMTARTAWGYDQTTGFRESRDRFGITTTFAPDAFGNAAVVTRANGTATSFTYSWGVVKDTSTPGVVVTRDINQDGTTASETVAGRATTYLYDDLMRVERTQPPGASAPIITAYDDQNRTVTTRRGTSVTTVTLDGFGRQVGTVNGAGIRTRTAYDADGRRIYQSHPFDGAAEVGTEFSYDALGRLRTERNADGTERQWEYDDVASSVTVRDESDLATVFGYAAFGHPDDVRLVSVTDANQQQWTYTYDAIGNLAQVIGPSGATRTWMHDTKGLLTSETHPESGRTSFTHYDAAGVLKRKVDGRGTEYLYEHDANNRVTRITAGSRVTDITYEQGSDTRLAIRNQEAATAFAYDGAGRLVQRQDVVGSYVFTSRYQYDGNDRITAVTYPSGRTIEYDRQSDPEGRIGRVFEASTGRDYAFGMQYHPSGALRGYTSGNLIRTEIDYDPLRYWITRVRSGLLDLTYGDYDQVGNVGRIGDSRGGMDQTFAYDRLHRLEAVNGPYGAAEYAYDPEGNRRTTFGNSYVYDQGTSRLVSRAGVSYSYDGNGNIISAGASTFAYTPDNRLAAATGAGATTAFAYDGDGWRIRKATSTDTTLYLRGPSGELLTEWQTAGADTRTRDFVYAGRRLLGVVDRGAALHPSTCGGGAIPDGSSAYVAVEPSGTGTVSFEGSACRRVSVKVEQVSGAFGCNWKIAIKRPDGTTLSDAVGGCTTWLFIEPATLPVSGTYEVVVNLAGTNSGTAKVNVWDVVDVGGPVVPGGPAVTVPITTPGQIGRYTFDATAGTHVSVQMNATWSMGCTWALSMLRPDGTTLVSATFCSGTVAFLEPRTLPVDGTYTVIVNPKVYYLGTVGIVVRTVVDFTSPIDTKGTPVTVPISTAGQTGRLLFEAAAGTRVSARLDASWSMGCTWDLSLLKPDGTKLASSKSCTGEVSFLEPQTLPVSGTYAILVDPDVHYLGTVSVRAYAVEDVTGLIRADGTAVTVPIATPGQTARLLFEGAPGTRISVRLGSTWNMWCTWDLWLVKSDGTKMASANSCTDDVAFIEPQTLPTSGTYTVLVDPRIQYVGTVSVRAFTVVDFTGQIGTDGAPATVPITVPGQKGRLTFQATAGQSRGVTLTATWFMGCTWPLSLLKPDGTTLATATSCTGTAATIPSRSLPVSGTYTVLVDPKIYYTGTVSVKVQ